MVGFTISWTSQLPRDLWLIRFGRRISEESVRSPNGAQSKGRARKGQRSIGPKEFGKRSHQNRNAYWTCESFFFFFFFLILFLKL